MSELDITFNVETIRRLDSSTIAAGYNKIGTPIDNAARCLLFCNNSTNLVTISFDGLHDHIDLVTGAQLVLDVAALKQLTNACWRKAGTQFYAAGVAGTGNICLTVFY